MEQIHISAMKDLHNKKNEEFLSDIISYIKTNNITEEDFFCLVGKSRFYQRRNKIIS